MMPTLVVKMIDGNPTGVDGAVVAALEATITREEVMELREVAGLHEAAGLHEEAALHGVAIVVLHNISSHGWHRPLPCTLQASCDLGHNLHPSELFTREMWPVQRGHGARSL